MSTNRMIIKSSTIFISVGAKTRVYRSLDEVSSGLRQKLEESTNSMNSATILIADRNGRREILKALKGMPGELRSRLASSLQTPGRVGVKSPVPADATPSAEPPASSRFADFVRAYWVEGAVPAAVGLLIWAAFRFLGR